jgi:hypothetical protein
MRAGDVDLSEGTVVGNTLEASVTLTGPTSQVRLLVPRGDAGRAEAVLQDGRWAAKHFWREAGGVMVYEFDGPLPAGPVVLRIPFTVGP